MIVYREGNDVPPGPLAALFAAVGFRRRTDPAQLAELLAGSRWVVSAWDGERLVGFARAISDGVSNAYVSTVAVHPDYQRRGIGRALLERLLAGRDGVKFVLHSSEAGERLYRSVGFVDATRMFVRDRRPSTVDEIVARWEDRRPPAPPEVQRAWLQEVEAQLGFALAADYVRFLALCDGGQCDAAWLYGAAPETRAHHAPRGVLPIGDAGNVDLYVLRADGSAAIVSLFDWTRIAEDFPSFTALLARMLAPRG